MIQSYLARDEGKTLEFKENCKSLQHIFQTAVAFANTAGGSIVIGVRDRTKEVVGITNPWQKKNALPMHLQTVFNPFLSPTYGSISGVIRNSL
jgi:ATP-dependent DNA helicase RecG